MKLATKFLFIFSILCGYLMVVPLLVIAMVLGFLKETRKKDEMMCLAFSTCYLCPSPKWLLPHQKGFEPHPEKPTVEDEVGEELKRKIARLNSFRIAGSITEEKYGAFRQKAVFGDRGK